MNHFTQAFEEVFRWVLQTSWQAAVLAGLILLAQWVLRKRLSAGWRYGLWLLLVGRLLMPATPQSALSVFNLIRSKPHPPSPPQFYANTQSNPYYDNNSFNGTPSANVQAGPIETAPLLTPPSVIAKPPLKIDWFGLALYGWLAGLCFFGARLIWANARFRSRIANCRPVAEGDVMRAFDECRAALNITQSVRVIESEEVETPAVYGLWRKWLLLPDGVFERFGESDLRCIFLHELAHIKRGDLGVNWLVSVLQVVHWFNPVLRLAFARMRADREMAADAMALAHIGKTGNVAYGETILKVVENITRDAAQPGLVGIAESKAGLAQRVRAIAQFTAKRHWKWAAVIAALAVAGVGLTDARQTTAPVTSPSASTTKAKQVREIAGVTIDPDGSPATGAQVAVMIRKLRPQISREYMTDSDLSLSGQPRLFNSSSGHLMGETRKVPWNYCTTGHDGRFDLDDLEGATFLLVADKKGFARIATNEFSGNMTVKLNGWGRIEGSVWDYSKPVADEPVAIGLTRLEDMAWGQKVKFETNTDSRGRFIFDYVPPGRFTVFSEGISQTFVVASGKATAVKIGGEGRDVVGKFTFPDSSVQVDWGSRGNYYLLVPEPARPPQPFKTFEDYIAWKKQPEFENWLLEHGVLAYQIKIAQDGSFNIGQVRPGNYTLSAAIHDPKQPYGVKPIGEFNGFNRPFEVPPIKVNGDEPVGLGVLEISTSTKEKTINGATQPKIDHTSADPAVKNGPTMKVTVLDAQTGHPVPNAEVLAPNYSGIFGRGDQAPRWTTDEQGVATIRLGELGSGHLQKMSWFGMSIRSKGYAPHGLSWSVNNADARPIMPGQLTVRLERGRNVGGIVHDEEGAPIAGVQVYAYGSSYWENSKHEYPEYWTDPPVTTDSQGKWMLKDFPDDLEYVSIKVTWPGGSYEQFTTSPTKGQPDNFRYQNPGEDFSVADLRAGKLSLTLKRGRSVQGVVLDPHGLPMAGVLLKAGCGLFMSEGRLPERRTDDAGRFEFAHLLRREIAITACPPDCALTSIIVDSITNDRPIELELTPLNPLQIRVEDGEGRPIAGAEITVDPLHTQGQLLDFSGKSDRDGNLIWTNAPVSEFALKAKSPIDGIEQKIRIASGQRKITFKLRSGLNKEVIVTARAHDAETGAPVLLKSLRFEQVFVPEQSFMGDSEASGAARRLAIPATVFTPGGTYPGYELEAQADGYATTYSSSRGYEEGDWDIDFALEKARRPGQVVLLPDGSPASRTTVWSHFDRNMAKRLSFGYPDRGVVRGNGLTSTGTGKDGGYDLPGEPDEAPVIFTHDDGFLQTTAGELRRHPRVQLKPYGRVQGVLRVAGQPKKEMRVCIATSLSEQQPYFLYCSDSTDSSGQFSLSDIPPGNYTLFRTLYDRSGPIIRDHQVALTVKAGETLKVDYSNKGRQVVGRAVSDDPTVEIDWLRDNHTLTSSESKRAHLQEKENIGNDYVTEKDWRNALDATRAKAVQQETGGTYVLLFKHDGSFQMDDVPPGKYWLSILVRKPGSHSWGGYPEFEDILSSYEREIVVPEGEGPFNLGELTVKTKDKSRSGS